MKKTKVCCFDVSDDIIAYLSESFDVYRGSFGKKIKVDNNRNSPHRYFLSNDDIPSNIHEYRIIIDDMLYNDNVMDYIPKEHEREYVASNVAYYVRISYPQNVFDPIPFASFSLGDNIKRKCNSIKIISILFQAREYTLSYDIVDSFYSFKHTYVCSNYEHTLRLADEELTGEEIYLCDNELSKILFEHHTDELYYLQTFHQPYISSQRGAVPDENFIPLLKNNRGDIVSYAYLGENRIEFMLPQMSNKLDFLKRLFNEFLFKNYSDLFPTVEAKPWIGKDSYMLPNHEELLRLKEKNKEDFERKEKELDDKIRENKEKYSYLHEILTESGDALVDALIKYFKWLGFDDIVNKDTTAVGGLFEEDIQINLGDDGILVVEVKGINGTSTDAECSQIHKVKFRRCEERGKFDVKALYIVNNERHIEPLKRTIPPFNKNQIRDAQNDKRGLLYTWQLYNLYFNIENGFITKQEARERMLNFGLIDLEPHLLELGKPYKYYNNHQIACIELDNKQICKNDYVAYSVKGRWYKVEIISIEQEHDKVDVASSGKVGIQVKGKLPECVLYHMKKNN